MKYSQYRMLTLLGKQIQQCDKCDLHTGGRCSPYFTQFSKYCIIGEAPGEMEVRNNIPFCGPAGKYLWDMIEICDLKKEEFLVINSVNCRPLIGGKNGKPTYREIECCDEWVRKNIKVLQPKAILSLGNYARYSMISESKGVESVNATVMESKKYNAFIVFSVHPAICIYKGGRGRQMLHQSIEKFKEIIEKC